MSSRPETPSLSDVLLAYFDARTAALLAARKSLAIGELDARALLFISSRPGTRPRDLGDYLGITSAGVTTLTDRLVARGTIRRDYDEEDRRVVRLTAVIDLRTEPWLALRRFDDAIAHAASTLDREGERQATRLVGDLTRSATEEASIPR